MLMEQTEFLPRLETARDRHTVYVRPEGVWRWRAIHAAGAG